MAVELARHLLAVTLALASLAGHAATTDPTSGDAILFPGSLTPFQTAEELPQSGPMGWNIPGIHFKSGDGWWALACRQTCTLTATRLLVTRATHPDYDGPPLISQRLQWMPIPYGLAEAPPPQAPQNASVIKPDAVLLAIFKPLRGLAGLKLREGPVKTWLHAGMQSYPRPNSPGTMETLIRMDDGRTATLLPRLKPATPDKDARHAHAENNEEVFFELRADGLRQRFEPYAFDMGAAHPLQGPNYLLWAGDLDGDGKLDLLISFAERGWNTVLYLSSLAKPGQLVGEAGRFRFWDPSDPGC